MKIIITFIFRSVTVYMCVLNGVKHLRFVSQDFTEFFLLFFSNVGMEDLCPGLQLPQPPHGGGGASLGQGLQTPPNSDCLHFQLSVSVQHSSRVTLPFWWVQRGKGRYRTVRGNRRRNKTGSCVFNKGFVSIYVFCLCAGELDYSSVLLGMLVMQDVQLSLFIAIMPTLIQAGSGGNDR